MTKIPGVKLFAYRVEEARGVKSKFYVFICSPTGPLALTALLKQGKKAFGHSAARFLKAKSNRLMCCMHLIIGVRK